jgi:glycosyltransferase involved in cell wall biosynthesis
VFKSGLRGAPVKIAILSSASAGGAGIAAYRIYQAFVDNSDHEVDFFDMTSLGQVNIEVSPTDSATNGKITNTHFTIDYASDTRQWVIDLLMDCDVINVQWASYLVSLSEIHELAKSGKKILFTLHDFHYITGGCHYPAGCTGFLKNCVGCPQVNEKVLSQQTVVATNKLKRNIFSYPNVHLSAPSQFIVDNAIRSGIVPAERAHVLRNAYAPVCEFEAKGNSKDKAILLIADSFDEQRKGLALAVDSLKIAAQDFRENNSKVTLHLVGGLDAEVIRRLDDSDIKVITHGHIKDHSKLVDIFKQCQFVLSCSYEDNWPNILVEAGSYGCIPIVGRWHGCEEFVDAFGLGYVASQYTAEQYAIAINQALNAQLANASLANFVKDIRVMHMPKSVVDHYVGVFEKENQTEISSSIKQEAHFSANYLAAMHSILLAKGQIDFVNVIESPFGGVYEMKEYKITELSGTIGSRGHQNPISEYSYGLINYKFKFKDSI